MTGDHGDYEKVWTSTKQAVWNHIPWIQTPTTETYFHEVLDNLVELSELWFPYLVNVSESKTYLTKLRGLRDKISWKKQ
jgi:hypothetical protein